MSKCKRVHHKKEPYDIYIGRPSKWGSPFSYKKNTIAKYKAKNRIDSIEKHKDWLTKGDGRYLLDDLKELKGKTLGCWCNPNQKCHGDIIVKLVNNLDKKGLGDILS